MRRARQLIWALGDLRLREIGFGGLVVVALLWFGCAVAIGGLREAIFHRGPGHVWYEQPERRELVDESAYRRHKAVQAVVGVVVAGFAAWMIYTVANDRANRCEQSAPPGV